MSIGFRFLCSIFMLFFSFSLFAREVGHPMVWNYHPREYKAFSQNWDIVKDQNKVLYFANGDGVLRYDGTDWDLIALPNNNTVTAMVVDSTNRIYVGGIFEFGYLQVLADGRMEYRSLMEKIKEEERDFSFVDKMYACDGGIYFNTQGRLYEWKDDQINSWELAQFSKLIKLRNQIIVWQQGKGFFGVRDHDLIRLKQDLSRNILVEAVLPYGEKDLVVSRKKGLFQINSLADTAVSALNEKAVRGVVSEMLEGMHVLNASRLHDGNYAVMTLKNGTLIVGPDFGILDLLNKNTGVSNETHNAILEDGDGGYWLALDVGISKVELKFPVNYWSDVLGLQGSVLDMCRFEGRVYAGTWQGLFVMEDKLTHHKLKDYIDEFRAVEDVQMQCRDLLVNSVYREMLVASTDGLYVADRAGSFRLINKKSYAKLVIPRLKSNVLLAANPDGVDVFYRIEEVYYFMGQVKLKYPAVSDLLADAFGNVLFLYGKNEVGVLEIEYGQNTAWSVLAAEGVRQRLSYNIALYEIPIEVEEKVNQLVLAGAEIYLSSDRGLYEIIQKDNALIIERKPMIFADTTVMHRYLIAYLGADHSGDMWGQAFDKINKSKFLFEARRQLDGGYLFDDFLLKPVPSMDIHCVKVDEEGMVWFCGDDGLYRYNSKKHYRFNSDFQALIKEVRSIKKDSLYVGGFVDEMRFTAPHEYRFNDNSLRIHFASPFYFKEKAIEYSYQLIGFDNKWSEWSTSSVKEYTNLSPGEYVFKVKARNIFGVQSREAQYAFVVASPWYLSPWGYGVYVVVFLTLIYFVIMLFNRRLLAAKQRLERIVRDRTLELVNRQKQIEEEKEKSDKLLLNILPIKIASELKRNGYAKTQYYEQTTVLFADFRSFTYISQVLEPQHLIKELDKRFIFFDDVCLRHNIEKIKTIGDAYMCVGGIPLETKTHAVDMVLAAFEMQAYMKKLAEETTEGHIWELRIGMHTGPIIAGVVGKNKFAYDVWGDTVNTASRVESSSQPGKINISGETYEVIKDFFVCTYRGKHPVKNRGEIDMYFVERIRPELANDDEGFMINKYFKDKYDQLNAEFNG